MSKSFYGASIWRKFRPVGYSREGVVASVAASAAAVVVGGILGGVSLALSVRRLLGADSGAIHGGFTDISIAAQRREEITWRRNAADSG